VLEELLIGDFSIGAVLFVSASEVWNVSFISVLLSHFVHMHLVATCV
jgi:hypothetical protein